MSEQGVLPFLDGVYLCEGQSTYFDVLSYALERRRTRS